MWLRRFFRVDPASANCLQVCRAIKKVLGSICQKISSKISGERGSPVLWLGVSSQQRVLDDVAIFVTVGFQCVLNFGQLKVEMPK